MQYPYICIMKFEYKERTITCIGCNQVITKRMPNGRNYCSLNCYRKSTRPNSKKGKNVKCSNCGIDVYKQNTHLKKSKNLFCSMKCSNEFQGRNKVEFICKICSKKFKWSKSRLSQANPTYCNIKCRNKDVEVLTLNSIKGNLANLNKNGLNKLELKGNSILEDLGIKYTTQVLMFNKFLVDVLVDEKKIIIQWDGEYWHNKPKRKLLDISQDAYLNKCGYKIIRITDKQIKNEINKVYETIRKSI